MVRSGSGRPHTRLGSVAFVLAVTLLGGLHATKRATVTQGSEAPITLKAGCTNPKDTLVCNAIDKFGSILAQKTNGRIKVVDLYQGLGIEAKLIQEVQAGIVDFGTITGSNSTSFSNALSAYSLPFLFDAYEAALMSLDSPVGKQLVKEFEKDAHLKFVMAIGFGAGRDIETRNKPLFVPADIKGLKIRTTASSLELSTYRAWGANPTPMDFSQVLIALQQGTIDGCDLDPAAVLSTKLYEGVRYEIQLSYANDFVLFLMNAAKFSSLSAPDQELIIAAAREAEAFNRQEATSELAQVRQQLAVKGVKIYVPTPAQRVRWASVRDQVWQQAGNINLSVARQLRDSQKR